MAMNVRGGVRPQNLLNRILDSDVFYSFINSPVTVVFFKA